MTPRDIADKSVIFYMRAMKADFTGMAKLGLGSCPLRKRNLAGGRVGPAMAAGRRTDELCFLMDAWPQAEAER